MVWVIGVVSAILLSVAIVKWKFYICIYKIAPIVLRKIGCVHIQFIYTFIGINN